MFRAGKMEPKFCTMQFATRQFYRKDFILEYGVAPKNFLKLRGELLAHAQKVRVK